MLSEKNLRDIVELEKAGMKLLIVDKDGVVIYSSQTQFCSEYCDKCCDFKLLPDPDPTDWFRDDNMKAVCMAVKGVIAGSLENSTEWTNISKPLYYPKLGHILNEEEKKEAEKELELAKMMMK